MAERPDHVALTRGQIAVLARVDAGGPVLDVVQDIVRLAQEVLGGTGAGFAEYLPGHGRIIAASGCCAPAVGRRIVRDDDRLHAGQAVLLPLDTIDDDLARNTPDAPLHRVLAARCAAGTLYVYFDRSATPTAALDEYRAVVELLSAMVGRLYAGRPAPATDTDHRDLWVAVTSHELRTPVTVIKGYADTLTNHWDSLGDDGRREAARIIGTRAGELARLVDRLLTATSEDLGSPVASAGPFDLAEALRAAAGELPAGLRARVRTEALPAELPKAYGQRDTIATILTELATNAEKNAAPGTAIELTATADEDTLSFRLADRGAGIAPEHVERAFERYWQAETGEVRHPGAGLGLFLVRRLVERQHGWVSLRPRDGGGTTAEVRLPRA